MTDRVECKSKAKELLRERWGNAAGICLVLFLLNIATTFFLAIIPLLGGLIVSAFSAFFLGTVINYFKKLTETEEKIKYTECFINLKQTGKIFLFNFAIGIIVFLLTFWTSIFSFPASVFGVMTFDGGSLFIALALTLITFLVTLALDAILFTVPMLIVDEENIGIIEAVKKSWSITRGFRVKYIIINLSFIGWTILSFFTLGIGMFWLYPYMNLTLFIFYRGIKKSNGLILS